MRCDPVTSRAKVLPTSWTNGLRVRRPYSNASQSEVMPKYDRRKAYAISWAASLFKGDYHAGCRRGGSKSLDCQRILMRV